MQKMHLKDRFHFLRSREATAGVSIGRETSKSKQKWLIFFRSFAASLSESAD